MKSFFRAAILALSALAISAPAAAQKALDIANDVEWTHPHSGIVVPASLGGLERSSGTEFAPDFLNVGFSYGANSQQISLYIYRDTNGGVPVWFEQARIGIENRDIFGKPQLPFLLEPYGWPGAEAWQGQRAIYATPKSRLTKSTGLALFSVQGWFVKIRASSDSHSADELGKWMDAALAELTPPSAKMNQPQSLLMQDCAEKLEFKKEAKDAKQDGAANLLGMLLGGIVADKEKEQEVSEEPKEAVQWCREGQLSTMQRIYRANASTDSYLIALGDSGIGVSVYPDSASTLLNPKEKSKSKNFAVTVINDSERINYVTQDRLPSFKRVLELVNGNRRTGSVSTWGEDSTLTISPDAMK